MFRWGFSCFSGWPALMLHGAAQFIKKMIQLDVCPNGNVADLGDGSV